MERTNYSANKDAGTFLQLQTAMSILLLKRTRKMCSKWNKRECSQGSGLITPTYERSRRAGCSIWMSVEGGIVERAAVVIVKEEKTKREPQAR